MNVVQLPTKEAAAQSPVEVTAGAFRQYIKQFDKLPDVFLITAMDAESGNTFHTAFHTNRDGPCPVSPVAILGAAELAKMTVLQSHFGQVQDTGESSRPPMRDPDDVPGDE